MTTHREHHGGDSAAGGPRGAPGPSRPSPPGFARIVYKDDRGTQTFLMTKDEIVIGRQAPDVWADLSTRHLARRLARARPPPAHARGGVPHQGPLEAGDDGQRRPAAAQPGGRRTAACKDLDRWEPLPDKARIGLAGVIYLDFERLGRRMTALYFARLAFLAGPGRPRRRAAGARRAGRGSRRGRGRA